MATREAQASEITAKRAEQLLADASEFFEEHLWEAGSAREARDKLAGKGLREKTIRDFGLGYAPIGPDELFGELHGRGYSDEEIAAAGLATLSARGRLHTQFRSRITFPVRDRDGRILGFAGMATHLGPSWPLWVTSPEAALYRRRDAVFGLDRAAGGIASSGRALLRPDCVEVLKAHQDRKRNAVTVHTKQITREQLAAMAEGVSGGVDALELELPSGLKLEQEDERPAEPSRPVRSTAADPEAEVAEGGLMVKLKKVALVAGTAVATINLWTGAPLLAVWVGSQVQSGRILSMWGVVTVVAVLSVLAFLLGLALTWMGTTYDKLSGRPVLAARTSPWHRMLRGDRVEDVRSRYGVSAPEKAVAACVVLAVLVFEVWFFFFAGSSLPAQ